MKCNLLIFFFMNHESCFGVMSWHLYKVRFRSRLMWFACGYLIELVTYLLKRPFFLHCIAFANLFLKSQQAVLNIGPFWGSLLLFCWSNSLNQLAHSGSISVKVFNKTTLLFHSERRSKWRSALLNAGGLHLNPLDQKIPMWENMPPQYSLPWEFQYRWEPVCSPWGHKESK